MYEYFSCIFWLPTLFIYYTINKLEFSNWFEPCLTQVNRRKSAFWIRQRPHEKNEHWKRNKTMQSWWYNHGFVDGWRVSNTKNKFCKFMVAFISVAPKKTNNKFLSYGTVIAFYWNYILFYRAELDDLLSINDKDTSNVDIELKSSTDVYYAVCRFLSLFKENSPAYGQRLEHLCRYLLASLESENPKLSYIGVALNKELSIAWIRHIKLLLYKCCICMEKLKPGNFVGFFFDSFGFFFIKANN